MWFHALSFRGSFSVVELVGEEAKEIFCSRGFPCCTRISPNRETFLLGTAGKQTPAPHSVFFFFWGRGWVLFAFLSCITKSISFSFMQKKEKTEQPALQDSLYPMGRVLGCDMGDSHSNLCLEPGRNLTVGLALWSFGAGETYLEVEK